MVLVPVASASEQIQVTNWNQSSGYLANITISNSTASSVWSISLLNNTSGVVYNLYSIDNESIVATATGGESTVLQATGLANGTYYIIQQNPSVTLTKFDPNNISCNAEFTISGSTIVTPITFTLNNVTSGHVYKLYNPTTNTVISCGVATGSNATINTTGLDNTVYRIAEIGTERFNTTYWNTSNATCNGIFLLENSTPVTIWNFTITNNGYGTEYILYTMPGYSRVSGVNVTGTNSTISVTNIQDGEYRIARQGTERLLFSYWNTSNTTTKGIFQVTNSTPFSILQLIFHDIAGSERYSVINPADNETLGTAFQSTDGVMIELAGLLDGVYHVTTGSSATTTFTNPSWVAGIVFVGASFILAAGAFINQRRMKK